MTCSQRSCWKDFLFIAVLISLAAICLTGCVSGHSQDGRETLVLGYGRVREGLHDGGSALGSSNGQDTRIDPNVIQSMFTRTSEDSRVTKGNAQ
jgi:hypothetical protein